MLLRLLRLLIRAILIACFVNLCVLNVWVKQVAGFNVLDYSHYLDYLPYRKSGLAGLENFLTAQNPPQHLRDRKMKLGTLDLTVEEVLKSPIWPSKWPYGFEDFRPLDYTTDEPVNTLATYHFGQSLIMADHVTLFPGLVRVPIRRHFVFPKDKLALKDHLRSYVKKGMSVLELFSTYESILPANQYGPVVGIGWHGEEMKANPLLDDYIEQDTTVDPFLPIADNYFDIVVVPAMFQLFQRPLDMFQEINRVLKPGGRAFIGVKLTYWSFLGWKQGRYYAETNYLEDIYALGSFFHYAKGFSKPVAFDLTLPEIDPVGKLKDTLFPDARLDFYAVVQAKKVSDSLPYREKDTSEPVIEGVQYMPRKVRIGDEDMLGPIY